MSLSLGSTTIGSLYLGSTKVGEAYLGNVKMYESIDPYNPLGLPPFTIRCQFTAGTTPAMGDSQTLVDATDNVWDITKNDTNWGNLFLQDATLVSVLGANSTGVTYMHGLFLSCTNLASVALFDTSSVLGVYYSQPGSMFGNCSSLTSVPCFDFSKVASLEQLFKACSSLVSIQDLKTDANTSLKATFMQCTSLKSAPNMNTSHVTTMEGTFNGCTALESVPLYDTSSVTAFYGGKRGGAFSNCSALKSIPLFNTSSATTVREMFKGCKNVESGALALYQQMSTQATPPTTHNNTFLNCGLNTTTGAAELSQIPSSWGGTGA